MHEARSYSASTKALRQDQSRTAEKSLQAFYKRFSGPIRALPLEPAGADKPARLGVDQEGLISPEGLVFLSDDG